MLRTKSNKKQTNNHRINGSGIGYRSFFRKKIPGSTVVPTTALPTSKRSNTKIYIILPIFLLSFLVISTKTVYESNQLYNSLVLDDLLPSYFSSSLLFSSQSSSSIIPTVLNEQDRYWRGRAEAGEQSVHIGARHPNGTLGMIVDPTSDRLLPFDFLSLFSSSYTDTTTTTNNNNYNNSNSSTSSSSPINYYSLLCPSNKSLAIEGRGGYKVLKRIRDGILRSRKLLKLQNAAIRQNGGPSPLNDTTSKVVFSVESDGYSGVDEEGKEEQNGGSNKTTTTIEMRARPSRILCLVYTIHPSSNHNTTHHHKDTTSDTNQHQHKNNLNLKAQVSTWGKQCDSFLAISNYTDHTTGSIDLPHQGPETYKNMWQKMRSMWAYVGQHYRHEYDFFYVCGDDVYVVMENLRAYVDGPQVMRLEGGYEDRISRTVRPRKKRMEREKGKKAMDASSSSQHQGRPLIFGAPMSWKTCLVPAGGPGYMINRAALDLLVDVALPSYLPDTVDSREDVFIGSFFCENGVYLTDTRDQKWGFRFNEGAEPSSHFDGSGPRNWKSMSNNRDLKFREGIDSVSPQTIGMHLKSEMWSDEYIEYKTKKFRKKREQLRGWLNYKRLWDFRQEVGVNFTVADTMYRYHAALYDLC